MDSLVFVVVCVIWLLFVLEGVRIARLKKYPDWAGALASLVLGPFVLLLRFIEVRGKDCPSCASVIPMAARVCPRCQREQPEIVEEDGPAPPPRGSKPRSLGEVLAECNDEDPVAWTKRTPKG